jgi:adenylate cyclase
MVVHEPREELRRLWRLLHERNDAPERETEIDAAIRAEFERRLAVMVLDMAGFSRVTARHGIIHYLAMIERMASVATPLLAEHGGRVIKQDADNLFVVFERVEQAVEAAQHLIVAMDRLNATLPENRRLYFGVGIGYGEVLMLGFGDLFGSELNVASKLGEDLAQREILLTAEARAALPTEFPCYEVRFAISGLDLVAYRVLTGERSGGC